MSRLRHETERMSSFPSIPVFLALWLAIGFILGTLTLFGPVRWWADVCRRDNLSVHWESGGVFFMIGTLVIGSGFVARLVTNIIESARLAGRIVIAVAVLAATGGTVTAWMHPPVTTPPEHRAFDVPRLERGKVYRLGREIYLTGYPTSEEFAGYVASSEIRQVVALLDPNDPDDRGRIEREKRLLARYGLPFTLIPISTGEFDAKRMYDAVGRVNAMAKPVLVHAFFSPSTGRSPWADGFMQAFFSGRPSLPPSLFDKALRNGKADVIAAHVAIGPRPTGPEFRELARRGVTVCLHVGPESAGDDASFAASAGMQWRAADSASVVAMLATGGPYYVYGGDVNRVRDAVKARFPRPVVP